MEKLKTDKSGFRLRGTHMTRIDAFSDVVFGFALTLLVVSLEVPKTYHELTTALHGMLAFAICFYFLISLWHAHYTFFRRYDIDDLKTISLNATLLFLILFFVYPMKFLFMLVTLQLMGNTQYLAHNIFDVNPVIANVQVEHLMMLYGFGFFLVYLVFALLHIHAWSKRVELQLNPIEKHLTVESIVNNLSVGAIGLFSVLVATITPYAGLVLLLIAPIRTALGIYFRRKIKTLNAH